MADSLEGKTLGGRYRLEKRVGGGGMSDVYTATDLKMPRTLAVKVFRFGTSKNWKRETQAIAGLDHRNILKIYDADHDDAAQVDYIVMQWLSGGALDVTKSYPLSEVASIIKQLADALQYAHNKGIIHRDVKHGNVMMNEHEQPILIDFSIALGDAIDSTRTNINASIGTFTHMSPEQCQGETLTPATDQYSLAVIAYNLVTGQLPFNPPAPTPMAFMYMHMTAQPPVPWNVPESVSRVLLKALAKKPEERYPNILTFGTELEQAVLDPMRGVGTPIKVGSTKPFGKGDETATDMGMPAVSAPASPFAGSTAIPRTLVPPAPIPTNPPSVPISTLPESALPGQGRKFPLVPVLAGAALIIAAFVIGILLVVAITGGGGTTPTATTAAAIAPTTPPTTAPTLTTTNTAGQIVAPATVPVTVAATSLPTTAAPTIAPTLAATTAVATTAVPTVAPTLAPTIAPSLQPATVAVIAAPATVAPTTAPTVAPTNLATTAATLEPTSAPTLAATSAATVAPTNTIPPTNAPTNTLAPTTTLTLSPVPSLTPTTTPDLGPEATRQANLQATEWESIIQTLVQATLNARSNNPNRATPTASPSPAIPVAAVATTKPATTGTSNVSATLPPPTIPPTLRPTLSGTSNGSSTGRLIFKSNRGGSVGLYTLDLDGANLFKIPVPGSDNSDPSPAPDGRQFAYVSLRSGKSQIYIANLDGSGDRQLTGSNTQEGENFSPVWSPDGKTILFISNRDSQAPKTNLEIYSIAPDGSAPKRLTSNSAADSEPSWFPDSKRFAFNSDRSGALQLWNANADGSSPQRITQGTITDAFPDISPDGKQVIFISDRSSSAGTSDNRQIFILNLNGQGGIRRLSSLSAPNAAIRPRWSPDSRLIAFSSTLPNGKWAIFTMTADGLTVKQISDGTASDGEGGVRWIP